MKAVVYEKYGSPDNLKYVEVDKPIPKDNEVLIKVCASSINSLEHRFSNAKPFFIRFSGAGMFKPKEKILGVDIAGKIEAIGKDVTKFKVGDEVYGDIFDQGMGAYAEYKCVSGDATIVLKPKNMTFEQTASIPVAAITALQALRDFAHVKKGHKVLVNGASGGVGTFAVLIAKIYGAEVTGVCSTKSVEMVRSIGADKIIDYKKEDVTKKDEKYDVRIEIAANLTVDDYVKLLNPNGVGVIVGFSTISHMIKTTIKGKSVSKKGNITICSMGSAKSSKKDLNLLTQWMEQGKLVPAIDRVYPLAETAEAMRYFEDEHATAKVVISMGCEG